MPVQQPDGSRSDQPPLPPAPGEPVDWDAAAAWVEANFAATGHWDWPPGWKAALFPAAPTEPPPPPEPGEAVDWWTVGAWVEANFAATGHWNWPPGWADFANAPGPPQIQVDLPVQHPGVYSYSEHGDTPGTLTDQQHGADQTLVDQSRYSAFIRENQTSTDQLLVSLFGDADVLRQEATGGNDTLSAFANGVLAVGDARLMLDETKGGDDVLRASSGFVIAYGDAEVMAGDAQGGNDSLTGGSGTGSHAAAINHLYGDAYAMSDGTRGGDDRVVGGGGYPGSTNLLYGDAHTMSGHAEAGNDTLVGGNYARDEMWGDAAIVEDAGLARGHDVFVMTRLSGTNIIHDFQPGQDVIDMTDYGFHDLADLPPIAVTDAGSTIFFRRIDPTPGSYFSVEFSITVLGDFDLKPDDFLFA